MQTKKLALKYTKNIVAIIVGTFIMGFSYNIFLAPNKITPTGFSGIATIMSYLLGKANINISASIIYLALNAILFVFAYKTMGRDFCIYSITGILGYSLAMQVLGYVHINLGDDLLLCTIYGGVVMGIGTGIVIRFGGSTGGADMMANILRKRFRRVSTGQLIILIDATIVTCSAIVYGLNLGMYALISCLIMGTMCDVVLDGVRSVRAYYIITNKSKELSTALMEHIHRGVSDIKVTGMYSGAEHDMLFVVVTRPQIMALKQTIKEIDPQAFLISTQVKEAMGMGFERLTEEDSKAKIKFAKKKDKKNNKDALQDTDTPVTNVASSDNSDHKN